MAFFQRAYNTRQYESACIGDSTKRLEAGCAVVLKKLAFGIAAPDFIIKLPFAMGRKHHLVWFLHHLVLPLAVQVQAKLF